MKGRVIRYSNEDKRGIIYYEGGTIGFNSFNLKSHERYCRVGSYCEFEIINISGKNVANEVFISEAFPYGKKIRVCGEKYDLREIKTIGLSSGYKVLKEGGEKERYLFEESKRRNLDLRFIFITFMDDSSYRYFDYNSPVEGDGKCDIDKEWDNLKEKIYERDDL